MLGSGNADRFMDVVEKGKDLAISGEDRGKRKEREREANTNHSLGK